MPLRTQRRRVAEQEQDVNPRSSREIADAHLLL